MLSVDLSPSSVSFISDIKAAISQKAQNTSPGKWLIGTGYNEFYLVEKHHPTRWDIDEVAPHHPVVLAHRSLHACMLNSLALSLAGMVLLSDDPTKTPPEQIKDIKVEMTIIGGEVVWEA